MAINYLHNIQKNIDNNNSLYRPQWIQKLYNDTIILNNLLMENTESAINLLKKWRIKTLTALKLYEYAAK